ncbi:PREDICTED: defensin-like protein 47 [Camelina sativa]|uniref:Defensin-like protein 47 n=1 Tax=Camelina sativa TaxID=90675 RepID=A0ABM0YRF2_CAMSA|nr:PREDICTED: defensin-like protein 47 [Camelina sativa]
MGSTKTLVICFFAMIFAVSLSSHNVLASENFSFDNCHGPCSEYYGREECNNNCKNAGFRSGDCGSPCIPCPVKCCCQK